MYNVGSDLTHELCPSRSAVVPSRALVPLSALPGALIKLEMPPWGAFVFSEGAMPIFTFIGKGDLKKTSGLMHLP